MRKTILILFVLVGLQNLSAQSIPTYYYRFQNSSAAMDTVVDSIHTGPHYLVIQQTGEINGQVTVIESKVTTTYFDIQSSVIQPQQGTYLDSILLTSVRCQPPGAAEYIKVNQQYLNVPLVSGAQSGSPYTNFDKGVYPLFTNAGYKNILTAIWSPGGIQRFGYNMLLNINVYVMGINY